ncbi:hypothetical protein FO519_008755 [Halicephalobus sp. NKZ332]|nr:hypothetical protein FO519_008755 [Halicephalobus sp. NKZ332]
MAPNISWEGRVNRILIDEKMGQEAGERIYGKTPDGKNFAIVLSSVLWYAVRVIIEDAIVERHEFYLRSSAEEFREKKHGDLLVGMPQKEVSDLYPSLHSESITRDFREYVENILAVENIGSEAAERVWGKTARGRYFVIITTSMVWYAVRVIVDGHDIVHYEQFLTLGSVQAFIDKKCRELKDDDYW